MRVALRLAALTVGFPAPLPVGVRWRGEAVIVDQQYPQKRGRRCAFHGLFTVAPRLTSIQLRCWPARNLRGRAAGTGRMALRPRPRRIIPKWNAVKLSY